MRRRELLLLMGGGLTGGRAVRAQQKAMPVIGWLFGFSPPANPGDLVRFGPVHRGLSETGFVEGQNMTSEYRWADFHYDRLPALAADLVNRKVDLIVTGGGAPPALAAKNATSTIPIVFTDVGDPGNRQGATLESHSSPCQRLRGTLLDRENTGTASAKSHRGRHSLAMAGLVSRGQRPVRLRD
jgi:putative tryptophan/tyrosine transport system substrate-binding protein